MGEVKWIKILVTMFEDEKIDFIESMPEADAILVIWIKLLTLAGKCNAGGYILLTENIPYTDEMLAHKFRRPISVVRLALQTFMKLRMIESDEAGFYFKNWDKHQNIEGLEKLRLSNKERQQRFREKQKLLLIEEKDIDKELDIDIERDVTHNVTDNVTKIKYAEYVSMLESEYLKLVEEFGQDEIKDKIEDLNNWKGGKGKRTKSDYLTIRSWIRKDQKEQKKGGKTVGSNKSDPYAGKNFGF